MYDDKFDITPHLYRELWKLCKVAIMVEIDQRLENYLCKRASTEGLGKLANPAYRARLAERIAEKLMQRAFGI